VIALCLGTFFFWLANTTVLPLLGQVIATGAGSSGLMYTSALVCTNEFIVIFVLILARWMIQQIGYKNTMLVGYCALPIRCILIVALYEGGAPRELLIATQVFDALGVGIFTLTSATVTRALTEGTGRFTFTLAYVHTMKSMAASASMILGGILAEQTAFGLRPYTLAFMVMGFIALLPILLISLLFKTPQMHGHEPPAQLEKANDIDVESASAGTPDVNPVDPHAIQDPLAGSDHRRETKEQVELTSPVSKTWNL